MCRVNFEAESERAEWISYIVWRTNVFFFHPYMLQQKETAWETIPREKCSVPCFLSTMFQGTNLAKPCFDSRLGVVSRPPPHRVLCTGNFPHSRKEFVFTVANVVWTFWDPSFPGLFSMEIAQEHLAALNIKKNYHKLTPRSYTVCSSLTNRSIAYRKTCYFI